MQLNDARIQISQNAVRVGRRDPGVRVGRVHVVSAGAGSALVVRLRNLGARAISDLPISVGLVMAGGARQYLNDGAGLDYFQNHIPAIGPHAALTWVFTTGQRLPATARAFAEVGAPPARPLSYSEKNLEALVASSLNAATLPHIAVTPDTGVRGAPGAAYGISVRNPSGVPQYDLQVYAFAERARRVVAAGLATIAHLGTGASTNLQLGLVGNARGAVVRLEAPPTIFG